MTIDPTYANDLEYKYTDPNEDDCCVCAAELDDLNRCCSDGEEHYCKEHCVMCERGIEQEGN